LLRYESHSRNTNNFASLPIASIYDTGIEANGLEKVAGGGDATSSMIAAVLNAAVNLGAPSSFYDITPRCPTGNCTWPLYQSLAICSTCNDLTSQLEGIPVELPEPGSNYTYPATNWTLSNGLYLTVDESQSKQGFSAMTMNVTNAPNAENQSENLPLSHCSTAPCLFSTSWSS
jgi:hypothetical protein